MYSQQYNNKVSVCQHVMYFDENQIRHLVTQFIAIIWQSEIELWEKKLQVKQQIWFLWITVVLPSLLLISSEIQKVTIVHIMFVTVQLAPLVFPVWRASETEKSQSRTQTVPSSSCLTHTTSYRYIQTAAQSKREPKTRGRCGPLNSLPFLWRSTAPMVEHADHLRICWSAVMLEVHHPGPLVPLRLGCAHFHQCQPFYNDCGRQMLNLTVKFERVNKKTKHYIFFFFNKSKYNCLKSFDTDEILFLTLKKISILN